MYLVCRRRTADDPVCIFDSVYEFFSIPLRRNSLLWSNFRKAVIYFNHVSALRSMDTQFMTSVIVKMQLHFRHNIRGLRICQALKVPLEELASSHPVWKTGMLAINIKGALNGRCLWSCTKFSSSSGRRVSAYARQRKWRVRRVPPPLYVSRDRGVFMMLNFKRIRTETDRRDPHLFNEQGGLHDLLVPDVTRTHRMVTNDFNPNWWFAPVLPRVRPGKNRMLRYQSLRTF